MIEILDCFDPEENSEYVYVIIAHSKFCPPCNSMQRGQKTLLLSIEKCPICGKPLFILGKILKLRKILIAETLTKIEKKKEIAPV